MRIGDGGDEWLRVNGAGEALTLSTVDFENFCVPRPELPGAALDDFEQAVRVLAGNDWGFRLHANYGETIDSYLAIFDVFAAGGCSQRHPVVLRPCRDGEPAVARAHRCSRRRHLRPEPHRYGR
jgi:hypothetical protein